MMKFIKRIKNWFINNPKKVYKYGMILLSITIIISIYKYIFFKKEDVSNPFIVPTIYTNSDLEKEKINKRIENKRNEIIEISKELEILKVKRDNKTLTNVDSLRVRFLLNKLEKLRDNGE